MIVNRRTTKLSLVIVMMLAMVFPTSVFAANGDLTSIAFDTNEEEIHLTVAETTRQLRVLATIEGSSAKKDVTNEATWTSSSTKTVKVEGGLLTPLDKGTATITAKYKGSIATVKVISKYAAEEFAINQPKEVEYKLGTEGIEVKALTDGTNDVTSEAKWTSSDEGVVTVDKGQLKLIGRGNATITASYKGLSASYKVKVISPYEKLAISPGEDQELLVGDDPVELKVYARTSDSETGLGTEVTDKEELKLKSSDTSVAKINDDGKLEPVALGKATITATYLGTTASIDVYVRNPYEALILTEPDFIKNPLMFLNDQTTIKAMVRNAATESNEVAATWTSSNPLAVTADGGKITARATGTSNIKVSYLGISKEFRVTVLPTVTEFKTDETEFKLLKDESKSVPKVTGTLLDLEKQDFSKSVQWTTSDEKVATVDDDKIKAQAKGEAVLTGKIGSKEVAEVKVIVNEKVLILLPSIEEYQIVTGRTEDLPKVSAVLENGDEEEVSSSVEWSLTGTAAVIKDGRIKGLTKGSTVLKGTYLNQSIKIPVLVEQEIVKIIVDPETVELNIKKSKSIKATGYYANGKTVALSTKMNWVSSNPKVVTTSRSSVKAVGEGTATVSGSYQGISVSVKVNVVPKLTKLTASEKKLKLAPGAVKTVSLTAEYDTGKTSSVTGSAQWSSSNTSVAKVTDGKIEAVSKGTARIKAKLGTKTVTVTVSVK
ncbi:hypothetical protein SAMN05661091_2340 [Paenibacillus uliginis N3/975]|uniref:BIG2 domain-containing protein n=1 Tax=Paenibacillus uliginis N3/975 TaxID=1313296 RepID=A0A1X7HD14_9BACL|nr:hypothetical protein [Paenibacillus uliginis]SMF83244.1 hypothetical protein SAMN05661091_2340 [Paenibacillus uliginis N3/975]